ncbi:hypothetical protein [Haloferula sp. BvORR071]|uniref:hypothetical protein n=1 Tax=Haloferula sp. BvORR071 TaxID=1396141 RepID=UPI00054CEAEE|nr:hypothetical protein [Haloferula sp. BvORR071]
MKTFTLAAAVHKLVSPEIQLDREIAERVGQEILRDDLEPAAWATALATSGGKRQEALAAYARIRMRKLANERQTRQAKSKSFEARRLNTCLGIKTVQDLLNRSNQGGRINLLRPKVSVIWLLLLMIGSTGSIACLARLLEPVMPDRFESAALFSAPVAGLAIVIFAMVLRALLPKHWVMQGWNTGIALVGTMSCFGSLYFGTKLIARTPPAVIQQLTGRATAPRPTPANKQATVPVTAVVVKPKTQLENSTAAIDKRD